MRACAQEEQGTSDGLVPICEATDEDRKRLELAAVRFIKIHHLESHARYMGRRTDPNYLPSAAPERALNRWGDLFKAGPSSDYRRLAHLLVAAEEGVHAVSLSEEPLG
jgi:hypothetical protein